MGPNACSMGLRRPIPCYRIRFGGLQATGPVRSFMLFPPFRQKKGERTGQSGFFVRIAGWRRVHTFPPIPQKRAEWMGHGGFL
jgi:hypothetical protein